VNGGWTFRYQCHQVAQSLVSELKEMGRSVGATTYDKNGRALMPIIFSPFSFFFFFLREFDKMNTK
jgi:hypothetical protein